MTTLWLPDPDPLLSPNEAASLARVTVQTLRRWRKAGRLDTVRLPSGQHRYRRSSVLATLGEFPPMPTADDLALADVADVLGPIGGAV